ncbi:MAG TPA: glycosyltransferase family 2 protein [Vicinamibacterales bacterium]|jgi:hypothetical protein
MSRLPTAPTPRASVVIVNFNGLRYITACLDSLLRSTAPPTAVVVVDNASTDGSADTIEARYPQVTLIRHAENLGFTGGANAGIRWCLHAVCDAILLLNPDAFVEPGAIATLLAASQRHPRALIGPRLVPEDTAATFRGCGPSISWWRGRTTGRLHTAPPSGDVRVDALSGSCLLLPRSAVEDVGYLDDDYFLYCEDMDFAVRARAAGWELWIAPGAVVRHRESSATGGPAAPLAMYYFVRNRHRFVRKFKRGRPVYAAFLAYECADVSFRVLRASLEGRLSLARALIRGVIDGWRDVRNRGRQPFPE